MGEVYKARDTRLDRSVAVKVLPDHIAQREDARARFEREARAVASLSRPGICTLHDIGPNYMVMELIDGETLAARIEKGPIPLEQAIAYATQIADALDRAHRAGVTHRDIKPQNIMLTRDGVKVLDFGLAKSASTTPAPTEATLTKVLTTEGMVLGTPQYMAPEQFEGREADARSDIWAFGAVLYEMVTGRKAFQEQSYSSLVGAILATDPPPMAVKPFTPVWLERLVRRCLAKDSEDRWQSMRDIVLELRTPPMESAAHVASRGNRWPWIAGGALAFAAALAIAVLFFRPAAAPAPEIRLDVVTPPSIAPRSFALSPDGKKIAYVASSEGHSRLWVRSLDSITAQVLPGTDGAVRPFWSPDGRSLGFFSGATLKRVDLDGTPARTLAQFRSGFYPTGTWGADTVLFSTGPLSRVPATGGAMVEFPPFKEGIPHGPYFLPGGRQFLFRSQRGLYRGSLDDATLSLLDETDERVWEGSAPEFLPPRWLFRVRRGVLEARQVDLARGKMIGEPIPVAQPMGIDSGGGDGKGWFSVASPGTIAWREQTARQLTWFSRSGENLGIFGPPNYAGFHKISPDGKRVIMMDQILTGGSVLLILEGTRASRFTDGQWAHWSPDGKHVAFTRANRTIHMLSADGSGTEEMVVAEPNTQIKRLSSWSPDGRFLLYNGSDGGSVDNDASNIMVVPLDENGKPGARKPFPFLKTAFAESQGVFSPDGKWVAYTSNESGQPEVYVRPFPGPGGVWQVSSGGGSSPRWRKDGKEMYYLSPDNVLMAAAVSASGTTFAPATPSALFQVNIAPTQTTSQYDVAPDGRFLINVETSGETTNPIHVLLNWKPPAK